MKAILGLAFIGAASAWAGPVVIVQPAPAPVVVSPLTPPASGASQALLGQISATLSQRRFDHDVSVARQQALAVRSAPVYRIKAK